MTDQEQKQLLKLTGEIYDIGFNDGNDRETNYDRLNEIDGQIMELIKSRDQQIALAARIDEPKPNTKEYLKLHSVKQPYTVHDIGYMDQLIRYHESIIDQLRKEIMQLKEN